MNNHDKILSVLDEVTRSIDRPVRNIRISAAVVYKKQIISIGTCQNKTHPFQQYYASNPNAIYLHAEIDAIQQAVRLIGKEKMRHCNLYVHRLRKLGRFGNYVWAIAKPCSGCHRCVLDHGLDNIIYTTNSQFGTSPKRYVIETYKEFKNGICYK